MSRPVMAAIQLPQEPGRAASATCWLLALTLHGACAAWLSGNAAHARPGSHAITEVELLAPPTPLPVTAPPAPSQDPEPAATQEPAPPARRRAARPRPAARAGRLLTATVKPSGVDAAEPVRFVTDPDGRGYGHGLVARGGSAEHGEGHAVAAPTTAPPPRPPAPLRHPSRPLSQPPRLVDHDGCRGYFPASARKDRGRVSLIASVRASGAIARLEVASESPEGEGFARAARECLAPLRFAPALDVDGHPTPTRTRVDIEFSR